MRKRYAVHPARIESKIDGQFHYVSYADLVRLYQVDPKECFEWKDGEGRGLRYEDYDHLYVRFDGKYTTPRRR